MLFFDYDLDGRLDLLSANGHLEDEIGEIQASQHYAQPAQLFWNSGATNGPTFLPVPESKAGRDPFHPMVGRGCACADIDGDLDVVITQVNGSPLLLRNDQTLGHHWLRLKLVGTTCNRDATGAWVRLRIGRRVQWGQVMPTRGYLSQSELPISFGPGLETRFDDLEVVWPGGPAPARARGPIGQPDDYTPGTTLVNGGPLRATARPCAGRRRFRD